MICTEVAGMKRVLVKIVLPVLVAGSLDDNLLSDLQKSRTDLIFSCIGYWSAVLMGSEKCV